MMGSCLERESNMAETYAGLSSSKPGISVQFYGLQIFATPPLVIPQEHLPLTCEQVCIRSAQHLTANLGKFFSQESQNKIGPKFIPLFGLYAADHSLQQWIPEAHNFECGTNNLTFYFRVKVRPARESIPEGLCADYLFWQCAEDFLTGRVWSHFDMENKIRDVNEVNKNALWVFMASGRYLQEKVASGPRLLQMPLKEITTLHRIRGKVTLMNIPRLLPKKMTTELEKEYNIIDPLMRFLSRRFMHTYIKDFFEKWGEENLTRIRYNFVEGFLSKVVPYYLLEYFPAEKVENYRAQRGENGEELGPLPSTSVELVIKPHQDGCVPGVYFNKRFKAHLKDITGAVILESESTRAENQKCRIVLQIQLGPPMVLDLPNQASAKSFLSVLETYCRLKYNYYESLNVEHLAAPSLQVLRDLHCFGPTEEEDARRYVRELKENDERLAQREAFYMLYQDTEDFNLLHATVLKEEDGNKEITTYNIHFTVNKANGSMDFQVQVGSEMKLFENKQDLWYCLTTTLGLGRLIFPKEENVCGAMQFLQDDSMSEYYYSYAGVESERTGKRRSNDTGDQPLLYRDDQVPQSVLSMIAQGEFSTVYRFKQMDQGREAILKKVTHKSAAVHEAYRKGAELLLKLHERSHFFVRVYGFMITSPTRIIYECMPDGNGSLLKRLRDKSSPPLSWLQVASVLKQLAECLCSLKDAGMLYGKFCCAKILIWKVKDTAITIRLGDPSQSLFCNTLELVDSQNEKRLAWLAPERWANKGENAPQKVSEPTLESEVYSLGTTLWEMLHRGLDPRQCIPSAFKRTQDFFKQHNRLPDPKFEEVTATHGDVASTPVAGSRTQQWVDNQHLTPDQDGLQPYIQGTMADSGQGSNLASGETGMTEVSGEPARPEEQSQRVNSVKETLRKIQEKVVKLMHDCWHEDPHQRPVPLALIKAAIDVEELAYRMETSSPLWHLQLLIQTALATNNVQDEEAAKLLQQQLQQQLQRAQDNKEVDKVLKDLETKVRQSIKSVIDHTLLELIPNNKLGEGQFGEVVGAYLHEPSERRGDEATAKKEKVAVKKMKNEQTPKQTAQFLKEVLTVFSLKHENVVKLIGVVVKGYRIPYQLVMEFADKGTLESYVKLKGSSLGSLDFKKELHGFAMNIAEGMQYICETEKMIHGDLAARNVLLFSACGSGRKSYTAKLSDFGLSHKLGKGEKGIYYYDTKKSKVKPDVLPIFW
ncbi:tyrosine-protein kinase JAK2-like isoform X1 [Littorina saxatilis]